jgi:dodecin
VQPGGRVAPKEKNTMAVAKVIEVNASSTTSVEDAVKHGLKKTSETVKGIKGVWVNEIKAVTNDTGDITEWRVNLRITFVVS